MWRSQLLSILLLLPFFSSADDAIIYTRAFDGKEYGYYHRIVLERILAVTPELGTTALTAHSHPMPQARQMLTVQRRQADVLWSMTNDNRERQLLAIKFPLLRGLSGYRALVIHAQNQSDYPRDMSLSQLKAKLAVQGEDWPDLAILTSQGFNVKGVKWSQWYVSMFNMVARGIVDNFPRNIIEIHRDLTNNKDKPLILESNHIIRYPTYEYFFVRKDNKALAYRIYTGLGRLLKNGELARLFLSFENHRQAMALLTDKRRRIHDVDNPFLSYSLPYARWDLHKDDAIKAMHTLRNSYAPGAQ